MPTDPEILRDVPFFSLLDDVERAALAERLEDVSFKAGTHIFNHGDPGAAMYVVRTGEVELFIQNDVGVRIVIETARAGDFFGETSLLDAGPRTASALVKEDVEAVEVD